MAFAPPCEELFFRGFLFPGLARRWGVAAAIVVSGILFSGAHLLPKSFIPIAGVGMVFGVIQYVYGRKYLVAASELKTPQTSAIESAARSQQCMLDGAAPRLRSSSSRCRTWSTNTALGQKIFAQRSARRRRLAVTKSARTSLTSSKNDSR